MLLITVYSYNTLMATWVANNLKPDYKRSVGLALYFSFANISGAVAGQIYPATDSPRYVFFSPFLFSLLLGDGFPGYFNSHLVIASFTILY